MFHYLCTGPGVSKNVLSFHLTSQWTLSLWSIESTVPGPWVGNWCGGRKRLSPISVSVEARPEKPRRCRRRSRVQPPSVLSASSSRKHAHARTLRSVRTRSLRAHVNNFLTSSSDLCLARFWHRTNPRGPVIFKRNFKFKKTVLIFVYIVVNIVTIVLWNYVKFKFLRQLLNVNKWNIPLDYMID